LVPHVAAEVCALRETTLAALTVTNRRAAGLFIHK
jgi:hypothetical protein